MSWSELNHVSKRGPCHTRESVLWLIILTLEHLQPPFWTSPFGNRTYCVSCSSTHCPSVNTLRPRQDGRHFADDIFTCIFFNENCCILIKFSLDNDPSLVQIMAWRRSGDKPLSEPMMISSPTHRCVTRPQWVKLRPNAWSGPKDISTTNLCETPVVDQKMYPILIDTGWIIFIEMFNSNLWQICEKFYTVTTKSELAQFAAIFLYRFPQSLWPLSIQNALDCCTAITRMLQDSGCEVYGT